ncbi:cysteine desulfurase [Centipeda periodontii DSM 2778]|uniref:cysteine desulfurase n=1 Tax=Centipeda periodontii DSM 2778 TaxID=888060 RepID=F5RLD2_9FIRM|nr:cysteine desulfurase family protein [Centipeda periodontii]EGK60687.1 cysteine desulfurase [Centipeda periodontii DSM 2778]
MKPVYLDYAATTPLDTRVLTAMQPYLTEIYGNPSSLHSFGQAARRGIACAREQAAALIGASPDEVFFTSGGTESDNWAIRGIAEERRAAGCGAHIVTSAVEHAAVRETCRYLARCGFTITKLPVDGDGRVDPVAVETALRTDTALVSIMTANNEVGTIEPIAKIGQIVRARGIPFHTDAVQAAGHIPLDVSALHVDALSFSAHKFCGPKGVGVLYLRRGMKCAPLLYGGAQERDLRAGTENAAAIVGCGRAAEIARAEMGVEDERLRAYTNLLRTKLSVIDGIVFHAAAQERLAGILNFGVRGIAQDSLLIRLDLEGFAVSAGSACSAGAAHPSHVLTALGFSDGEARSAIRVSLGRFTEREDVLAFADAVIQIAEEY